MSLRASKFARLAAVLLLGLSACSPDGTPSGLSRTLDIVENGPIVPVVQSETVVPGANVAVVFRNTVGFEFWFNPCERFVERRVDGAWRRLPDELRLCNSMAYILLPNAEREELVDAPLDLTSGTYRFVFPMRRPAAPDIAHWAASTSFAVRASSPVGVR